MVVASSLLIFKIMNTVKVYEILGMDRCALSTVYLGTRVNLEFKGGDVMTKKNGTITTGNPFIQAAIEAMPAFGHRIVLKKTFEDKPIEVKKEIEDAPIRPRATKVKAFAKEKKASVVENSATVVAEVKNVNDAAAYFMEKGITVESKEQLKELMQKHDVEFPNLVME